MQAEVQSTERRAGLVFTTRSTDEMTAFSGTAEDASRTASSGAAPAVHVAAFAR